MPDRWRRSREYLERARQSLTGGVSSPFRAKAPMPLYFAEGHGSRLRDVDGNEYIDYLLAWGPLILGHCHPRVVEAVRAQAGLGHIYGAQHDLEFHAAEAIQRMVPCSERVAFTSSGSEAVQLALRLARAFTGRRLIVKFEGHYHGWMDSVLWSYKPSEGDLKGGGPAQGSLGQVATSGDSLLVAPWNDLDAVETLFREHGDRIAAVITEPVLCNSGCLLPGAGYLAGVAACARRHGALVIFDEIITGFRLAAGGAQQFYGVVPDLATFGKAVGGGLPLSVVAGRREILELMAGGGVAFGGTFNGNPLSLAAAVFTLEELERNDGQALVDANRLGTDLMRRIQEVGRRHGLPLTVTGFGTAFALHFTQRNELRSYRDTLDDDAGLLGRCLLAALAEGIHTVPDGRFYVSTAHSAQDIEETVAAMDRAFQSIKA